MSGHVLVHRQPGGSLEAQVASWRLASVETWRLEETRVALAGIALRLRGWLRRRRIRRG